MIKDPNIIKEGIDLKRKLNKDFVNNYPYVMKFLQSYHANEQLQANGILIGAMLNDIMEEEGYSKKIPLEKKSILLAEAYGLIDKTLQLTNVNDISKYELQLAKLKDYFYEMDNNDIVFLGSSLKKHFNDFELKPIDIQLRIGEITSLVGENGNGKSTLLKIIAGVLAPDSGRLSYPLFNSGTQLNWLKIKASIGYVPQQIEPWRNFNSVKEQLHFTASTKGLRGTKNQEAVEYILTRLSLRKYSNARWKDLSGGYQLRFELARQLIWNPKLLILDEPLANLDVKGQNLLLHDLRNLTNSLTNPMSIILSSQNLYEIENISNQVIFMKNGDALYNGAVNDISEQTNMNCFIVDINCSTIELQQLLLKHSSDIIDIRDDYAHKIIMTTRDITYNKILKSLLNSGLPIKHFRDISNSTRILFENEQNRKGSNT